MRALSHTGQKSLVLRGREITESAKQFDNEFATLLNNGGVLAHYTKALNVGNAETLAINSIVVHNGIKYVFYIIIAENDSYELSTNGFIEGQVLAYAESFNHYDGQIPAKAIKFEGQEVNFCVDTALFVNENYEQYDNEAYDVGDIVPTNEPKPEWQLLSKLN